MTPPPISPPSHQSRATKLNFDGGKCICDEFFSCHDCRDNFQFGKEHDEEVRKKAREEILNKLCDMIWNDPMTDDGVQSMNKLGEIIRTLRGEQP